MVEVEAHAALQVLRLFSSELCAEHLALWHDELEKVLHHGAWLARVHLEQKISIECDDARSHQ